MDTVFFNQMGQNLEVYIDNMVFKTQDEMRYYKDLKEIILLVRKFNMRLNPNKCSFGV